MHIPNAQPYYGDNLLVIGSGFLSSPAPSAPCRRLSPVRAEEKVLAAGTEVKELAVVVVVVGRGRPVAGGLG